MIREAKAWKTGDDHIEGVGRIASVTGWIGEQGNELVEAIERVGPAMREQERQGVRPLAPLVNEVNTQAVDLRAKLRELVEFRLLHSPVEVMLPIAYQLLSEYTLKPLLS